MSVDNTCWRIDERIIALIMMSKARMVRDMGHSNRASKRMVIQRVINMRYSLQMVMVSFSHSLLTSSLIAYPII